HYHAIRDGLVGWHVVGKRHLDANLVAVVIARKRGQGHRGANRGDSGPIQDIGTGGFGDDHFRDATRSVDRELDDHATTATGTRRFGDDREPVAAHNRQNL